MKRIGSRRIAGRDQFGPDQLAIDEEDVPGSLRARGRVRRRCAGRAGEPRRARIGARAEAEQKETGQG
jgi:hypothetical protein